jgi:septum formation protein
MTLFLSQGKARSVAALYPDAIVIGADTVAVFENEVLGKPHTEENSHRMLSKLSKNVHSMVTGLTVIDTRSNKEFVRSVETKDLVSRNTNGGNNRVCEDRRSAKKSRERYAYQLNGHKFVERVEGSVSNIIGMPVEELREILQEF